jgi:hypothetical protein
MHDTHTPASYSYTRRSPEIEQCEHSDDETDERDGGPNVANDGQEQRIRLTIANSGTDILIKKVKKVCIIHVSMLLVYCGSLCSSRSRDPQYKLLCLLLPAYGHTNTRPGGSIGHRGIHKGGLTFT